MRLLLVLLTLLTASPAWAASVNLTWTDNAGNELAFEVERKAEACGSAVPGGAPFVTIATVGLNVVAFTDAVVTGGTTYCYRVRATNAVGPSAYSNLAEVVVPVPPSVPAAPSGLTAQPGS